MSTSPALPQINAAETGEATLFDSLARLVPPELQTDYYRVLAHTRTLGPDDEMLRILEAMGILALVTRHTPKDIADERERIQEMLDCHLQFSDESQQKMQGYVHFWIPLATGGAMLIGMFAGIEIQGCKDSQSVATTQSLPMQTLPTASPEVSHAPATEGTARHTQPSSSKRDRHVDK
jgi:hypothetical protein